MTYPVVAHGEARLRFQVSAAHTEGDLDQAAQTIGMTKYWLVRLSVRKSRVIEYKGPEAAAAARA